MTKAIDTTSGVRPHLDALKLAGIKVVGRYYSKHDWKVMSAAEAKTASAAGLSLYVVYEDGADPSTFTAEKRWAIAQGMPPSNVSGLSGDPDELNPALPTSSANCKMSLR